MLNYFITPCALCMTGRVSLLSIVVAYFLMPKDTRSNLRKNYKSVLAYFLATFFALGSATYLLMKTNNITTQCQKGSCELPNKE